MKKLVYILSLAIGLIMTGCAQWENIEPMSPDTWGPTAELTVETPDTIKTDVLPIKVTTKNATHIALTVTTEPAEIDYTTLLQGGYGAYVTPVDSAGDVRELTLPGVVPGNTYYVYVVAANHAGVQTTYNKAIGAYDFDAPYITSALQLNAGQGGTRVTLNFNESIMRDDEMGAITYTIYHLDVNTGAATPFKEGTDVNAVASGANLTVTVPVEYAEGEIYIAMLSFAEGAVTDIYGNKMAAVQASFDETTLEVTNGWWWLVQPTAEVEGFFQEGAYNWVGQVTTDGKNYSALSGYPCDFSYVGGGFDMGNIFEGMNGVLANEWEINGFLGIFSNTTENPIPALSYTFEYEGAEYESLTVLDYNSGKTLAGTMTLQGTTYDIYLGELTSDGSLYTNWEFLVMEGEAWYAGEGACIFILDGNQPSLLAMFADLKLTNAGAVAAGSVMVFDEPMKLENCVINTNPHSSILMK